MKIGTRQSSILSCHDNRLPTTHQRHATTPPLLDRHAVLHWTQSGINCSSKALTCTDCTSAQGQAAMLCFAACGKLSVENCHIKLTHALIAKPLVYMWELENCYGNNGRLISRTGAVFLIFWTPQGAVLAGTESSVPDSFPPLAIASLRAVCQWCCTPLLKNDM